MASPLITTDQPTEHDRLQAAEASSLLSAGHLEVSQLPDIAIQLLSHILDELAHGHALSVTPVESDMTTNEAADYLNVSRPYLIKLLTEGKIPFHQVGTHKRVSFQDIAEYKRRQKEHSYQLLSELQAEAQELNMGY